MAAGGGRSPSMAGRGEPAYDSGKISDFDESDAESDHSDGQLGTSRLLPSTTSLRHGLVDITHHVIGCHLPQETSVCNAYR